MDGGNCATRCDDAGAFTIGDANADSDAYANRDADGNADADHDAFASARRAAADDDADAVCVTDGVWRSRNGTAARANDEGAIRSGRAHDEAACEEESRLRALRRTDGNGNAVAFAVEQGFGRRRCFGIGISKCGSERNACKQHLTDAGAFGQLGSAYNRLR